MLTSNCSFLGELQEPFRWIADVAVMEAFEGGVLDLPDFYFTGDDHRYRFETEGKRRFLDLIRERFNSRAVWRGRVMKWDSVIEHKTMELARFLKDDKKSSTVDFVLPAPMLESSDSHSMAERIRALNAKQAKRLRIAKSTLHYLRYRSRTHDELRVYAKTREKLLLVS